VVRDCINFGAKKWRRAKHLQDVVEVMEEAHKAPLN